ncbi:hypothetical protein QN277_014353 [Acacia crassicarpa]|uniref:Transmembrane protein n=1 Tax=Acacia crassicarpa TaxID=499986 RepID=A0AAE1IMQ2_9FABA|nr:hypothetical protein QN277_014353 [Acacia crassicarpa]
MAEKPIFFLSFLLFVIVLQLNLGSVAGGGSRKLVNIHPPAIDVPSYSLKIPKAPSSYDVSYTTDTYKINEGDDAFRPTTPGHSPGVGHDAPPGARA